MDDESILDRIGSLVSEERELRDRAGSGHTMTGDERTRLREIEERLDQCWDLLRQRRAKEEVGADPDTAQARPISEVESYRQ
jgi:hypothetical protein